MTIPAGVAAGHPATAAAGIEALESGGTAADAAVAACLASCVAETVMTGLLGGGHGIYLTAGGEVRNLDCFVSIPTGHGAPMVDLQVPFGTELVHYAIGAASCAVPGLPAGLDALWRAYGRLPWAEVVAPALRVARDGVELTPAHASCLEMLAPVFTLDEGARIYSPGGRLLASGERLRQPGLVRTLEALAEEGAASVYEGTVARALLRLSDERGGRITSADLAAYRVRWSDAVEVPYAGTRFLTRDGVNSIVPALRRMPCLRGLDDAERPLALVEALAGAAAVDAHTTNLVAADRSGNVCVLTTSLGLGSGDFLPGLDLHLNSVLGETELMGAEPAPGERMGSMMSPSIAVGGDGVALAIGAAGGSRLRTALVAVAAAILDEGVDPQAAVDRPRLHPVGGVLHCEPGVSPETLDRLRGRGWDVREWPARHHYFGGVSAVARSGAAADPRRDGRAGLLP